MVNRLKLFLFFGIAGVAFLLNYSSVLAIQDESAPVVTSIEVDDNEVLPGDTINFIVNASDLGTGISNIQLNLSSLNGKSQRSLYLNVTSQEESYSIPYTIGKYDLSGEWCVSAAFVTDGAFNTTILMSSIQYQEHPNVFDATSTMYSVIVNEDEDGVAPIIENITISSRYLEIGETLTLAASVKDSLSGVKFVDWKYFFPNRINHGNLSFLNIFTELFDPIETKLIINEINFDASYPTGIYDFEHMAVSDDAQNMIQINSENYNATDLSFCFNCIHMTKVDIVDSNVTLDDSKQYHKVVINFSPSNATDQSIIWSSTNEDVAVVKNGVIVAKANGTSTITAVNNISGLSDTIDVTVSMDETLVFSDTYEFNMVESLRFSKVNVVPGDVLTITVKLHPTVKRESSIGFLMYGPDANVPKSSSSFKGPIELQYDQITDSYIYDLTIDNTYFTGDYYVYKAFGIEPGNFFFTVNEGRQVPEFFIPTNITISEDKATLGDKIKFVVAGKFDEEYDKTEFIPKGKIRINGSERYGTSIELIFNELNNTLEGELVIDEDFSNGEWSIESLNLGYFFQDLDGTTIYTTTKIIGSQDALTENIRLDISGVREPDFSDPIVKSITLESKHLNPGDRLKISIELFDKDIARYYAVTNFTSQNISYMPVLLEFNELNNRLEGEISITEDFLNGDYSPVSLYVYDEVGNFKKVQDLEKYDLGFSVINGKSPSELPIVKDVFTTKKNLTYGDAVFFLLDLENPDKLPVHCMVRINGPMNDFRRIPFWLNEGSGDLEGSFIVDSYMSNGVWRIFDFKCETNSLESLPISNTSILTKEVFSVSMNSELNSFEPFVSGVEDDKIYNTPRTIKSSGWNLPNRQSSVTLMGFIPIASGYVFDKDGDYTLAVNDRFWNQYEINFTIDMIAPIITGVVKDFTYSSPLVIKFNEGTATLNGQAFTSGTSVSAAGKYALVVADKAGNVTTVNFEITYPSPSIPNTPTEQSPITQTTVTNPNISTGTNNQSSQPSYIEKLNDLTEILSDEIVSNLAFTNLLKDIFNLNPDFISELDKVEYKALEDKILEVYASTLGIRVEGNSELKLEGYSFVNDLAELLKGSKIEVLVQVGEEINSTDQSLIDSYVSKNSLDSTMLYSIDLELFKSINGVEEKLTTLKQPVTITLPLPSKFAGVTDFTIIHVHEGTIYELPVIINGDGTFSFTTDKFSSFTLIDAAKLVPVIEEVEQSKNELNWLWGGSLVIMIALAAYFIRKRSKIVG